MAPSAIRTTCCIAGGGPAGMMLGLLLARAGIDVVVVEKHADFLRDFRGDTLHPSTLEVIHELGFLDGLLKLPHQRIEEISAETGGRSYGVADFRHLPVTCPAIVLMPQWDFLDFLKRKAELYPNFRCLMGCNAVSLDFHDGRIVGLEADHGGERLAIQASLIVAADGRRSELRGAAGLEVETLGAPIDVMWFRVSRKQSDTNATAGRFDDGGVFVRIYRGDYWQCGYVVKKGEADTVMGQGIDAFRAAVAALTPFDDERLRRDLPDFSAVSVLSVAVDRLRRWHRPGFLCIGDAAHAMSPVGGVGINLAIQDAVATANLLSGRLASGTVTDADLEKVQARRFFPTRLTQAAQVVVQNRILSPTLSGARAATAPLPLRLLGRFSLLRRIPARLVGMGVRPEHVRSPKAGG
ncbi:FAD-dependent oxidoreductase [Aliihoeflea aestuarii]|uniref:FAD-dependent oxidoreductase n=1 Tax=Aliihoeflea aestuarii TaxID=453840 RepID=UPI00209393CC|nr:FAD-dependent oxidoreductase [Aliihoeflea aestuarii]MCO6390315.1 FAD-dependent oxidoreductase [Aliihoeflea aestuarii]